MARPRPLRILPRPPAAHGARALALGALTALAGCAQGLPEPPAIPPTVGPPSSAVFLTPDALALLTDDERIFDFENPEYARRDALVGWPPGDARPSIWAFAHPFSWRGYDVLFRRLDRNVELHGPAPSIFTRRLDRDVELHPSRWWWRRIGPGPVHSWGWGFWHVPDHPDPGF